MELFVVEITAPPARPREENVARVVEAFKVDTAKANRLLDRIEMGKAPVTVSRPGQERDAQRTARNFESLGFKVRVRPYTERSEPGVIQAPSVPASIPAPEVPVMLAQNVPVEAVPMPSAPALTTPVSSRPHDVLDEAPTQPTPPFSSGKKPHNTINSLSTFLRGEAKVTAEEGGSAPTMSAVPATPGYTPEPDVLERDALAETPNVTRTSVDPPTRVSVSGRVSLRRKFLIAAILPTLLTVASAVAAILLTVPGALRGLLLESARNPAIALADGVGSLIPGDALEGESIKQIQASLNLSRATFFNQNVQFVMVTDAVGNPLAGWYGQEPSLAAVPAQVRTHVQTQARRATARAYMEQNGIPLGRFNPPSRLVDAAGTPLEVAAHPVIKGGNTIGNAVVGMSGQVVAGRVTNTLVTTLLASTLPVILAIMIALWLARTITTNVLRLVKAADRISLGELNEPVGLKTNDELNELGEALERMRVSLQESLERLRRRRR
jgi:HAMP domain-containing protein